MLQGMERPRRILLATDLSARSDRATERAALVMREHDAELVVLHVMEPPPDPPQHHRSIWTLTEVEPLRPTPRLMELVRRQLPRALVEAGDRVRVRVEAGDPPQAILDVAREESCDLLVTGVARNEFLGGFTLGKTVDRLLRVADPPILIVTNRASAPYGRVVVATDLSPASLVALETAVALLPKGALTVFHSREVPYTSLINDRATYKSQEEQAALADTRAFLESAGLSADVRERLEILVRAGAPEGHLAELARQGAADLVALTTHGRGAVMNALIGSVAKRIVSSLPCDALVVRAPRA
jgi:nucleotide-binding universal stress UspA family protein